MCVCVLTLWEKLFIKENEDLVMSFDILSENDQEALRVGRMAS